MDWDPKAPQAKNDGYIPSPEEVTHLHVCSGFSDISHQRDLKSIIFLA